MSDEAERERADEKDEIPIRSERVQRSDGELWLDARRMLVYDTMVEVRREDDGEREVIVIAAGLAPGADEVSGAVGAEWTLRSSVEDALALADAIRAVCQRDDTLEPRTEDDELEDGGQATVADERERLRAAAAAYVTYDAAENRYVVRPGEARLFLQAANAWLALVGGGYTMFTVSAALEEMYGGRVR